MSTPTERQSTLPAAIPADNGRTLRLDSKELFRQGREVEIEHAGRIYKLRLTQLNKLILTA